jgi:hypothetical protein
MRMAALGYRSHAAREEAEETVLSRPSASCLGSAPTTSSVSSVNDPDADADRSRFVRAKVVFDTHHNRYSGLDGSRGVGPRRTVAMIQPLTMRSRSPAAFDRSYLVRSLR